MTSSDRLDPGVYSTSRMDSPTFVVSNASLVLHARREALREPIHFRDRVAVHVQRVRVGKLRDAEADRVVSVEPQVRRYSLSAPSSARPTSLNRTSVPSAIVFRMMLSNCDGLAKAARSPAR